MHENEKLTLDGCTVIHCEGGVGAVYIEKNATLILKGGTRILDNIGGSLYLPEGATFTEDDKTYYTIYVEEINTEDVQYDWSDDIPKGKDVGDYETPCVVTGGTYPEKIEDNACRIKGLT